MKKLKEYKELNYRMVFEFDPEEKVYIVKFPELPGCIAHGETSAKALENALQVKDEWLEAAYEDEWIIPEPSVPAETSGRVTLRVPKYVHEKVIDRASREGISINQLLLTFVAEGLERISAKDYLEEKMGQQNYEMKTYTLTKGSILQDNALFMKTASGIDISPEQDRERLSMEAVGHSALKVKGVTTVASSSDLGDWLTPDQYKDDKKSEEEEVSGY